LYTNLPFLLFFNDMRQLLFCLIAILACGCGNRDGYVIKGIIKNDQRPVDSGIIYLFNGDMSHADTVGIKKGKFVFKGRIESPDLYFLMVEGSRAYSQIFLENDKYHLIASLDKNMDDIYIKGGKNQRLYTLENEQERKIGEKYDFNALNIEFQNPGTSPDRKDEILKVFNKIQEEVKSYRRQLMNSYPLSYFTLKNLLADVDALPVGEVEERLGVFKSSPEFAHNSDVDAIASAIDQLKLLQPGMKAPDFIIPDRNGKDLRFSDVYKSNKITLLDFWAGWCAPCRKVHPLLKDVYSEYHSLGFEILAVSFDSVREKWLDAIEEDGLPWLQVSDVKHWNSIARDLYHITYVPQYVVVNSDGIILKRKITEEELQTFLKNYPF